MKKTPWQIVSFLLLPLVIAACGGGGGGGDTLQGSGGAPIASISAAGSVTQTEATLNGHVTPNGHATQAWFEYGTDASLTTYSSTPMQALDNGLIALPVLQAVSGCTGGTVYYFRVCGTNAHGTTKSTITSFTTSSLGMAPAVTTLAATSVAANSVTLNGNVTPNGLVTTAWFEWGTSSTLATYSTTSTQSAGSGTTSQSVNTILSGLSVGTTYYVRVAANNATGTSRGTILSFTAGAAPTVATLTATSITATGATLNGNVTANGLATTAWFEWGTNSSLSTYSSTPTQSVGSGTTLQLVTNGISGLSSGTTYYYRIAASNASGTNKGGIASFTYNAVPPGPVYSGSNGDIAIFAKVSGSTITSYVSNFAFAFDDVYTGTSTINADRSFSIDYHPYPLSGPTVFSATGVVDASGNVIRWTSTNFIFLLNETLELPVNSYPGLYYGNNTINGGSGVIVATIDWWGNLDIYYGNPTNGYTRTYAQLYTTNSFSTRVGNITLNGSASATGITGNWLNSVAATSGTFSVPKIF